MDFVLTGTNYMESEEWRKEAREESDGGREEEGREGVVRGRERYGAMFSHMLYQTYHTRFGLPVGLNKSVWTRGSPDLGRDSGEERRTVLLSIFVVVETWHSLHCTCDLVQTGAGIILTKAHIGGTSG